MTTLPRKNRLDIAETVFLRPQRPDDHRELEWLLPQCEPLFVYADEGGRDWIRWEIPRAAAASLGFSGEKCSCCGDSTAVAETTGGVHADTAYNEVNWYLWRKKIRRQRA